MRVRGHVGGRGESAGSAVSQKIALGVRLRSHTAPRWRGVVDETETKVGVLGAYTSGQRVWRCEHRHRSEDAAQACAERHLRATKQTGSEER